jgi:hypothetical protein
MRIHVCVEIHRSPREVWADIEDVGSHVEWMADAESITFVTEQRAGVGTAFDCTTRLGPIRLQDRMTITEWVPEQAMGVTHRGIVTGSGVFVIEPATASEGRCTQFCWEEVLKLPWHLGGPIGEIFAKPILSTVWRRNLKRLKARIEAKR